MCMHAEVVCVCSCFVCVFSSLCVCVREGEKERRECWLVLSVCMAHVRKPQTECEHENKVCKEPLLVCQPGKR